MILRKLNIKLFNKFCKVFKADRSFIRFYDDKGDYLPVDTEYIANQSLTSIKGATFKKGGLDKVAREIQLQNKPVIMFKDEGFQAT